MSRIDKADGSLVFKRLHSKVVIVIKDKKRMLLKRGMGNGEWGMGNGEWGMGNGEWEIENGKLKMGN